MTRTCFFAILLLVCWTPGESLKCYRCEANKGEHNACEELAQGVEHLDEQQCSADQVCAVYVTKNTMRDKETIKRGCKDKDICESLKQDHEQFTELEHCHVCHTDLCNSGEVFRYSFVSILAGLILCKFLN